MAFFLNRSGRQMVRLSSSAAKPPQQQQLQVLSASVNFFSTTSDMNQESNRKAALKDLVVNCADYFAKNLVNAIQKKPLPSDADFHKHMDDLLQKLRPVYFETNGSMSETLDIDQAEKNPKAFTPEMIKAASVFVDTVTGGFLNYIPKPAYKAKGDKFVFTLDRNGLYLTVNVSGLEKEHLVVWVVKDRVLVASTEEVAPDQKIQEAIKMPDDHDYDPDQVTGSIIEGGELKISFPISKEDEQKEKYFEVNLV